MAKPILWLMAAAFLCAACYVGFRPDSHRLSDFAGYYTASRILVEEDSISRMYEDGWFKAKMQSYGIADTTMILYVNPPPVSLVTVPLAWMKPGTAKLVWNIFNVVLLFIAAELLRSLLQIPLTSIGMPILALVLTCSLPFVRNLQRGQLYVLMLVLLVLVAHGYKARRPYLVALPLAALLLLKYFGWMFLLLFLLERRWRELAITLISLLGASLLGVFLFGAGTYAASFEVLRSAMARSDFSFTGLPCVPALFGSLFAFNLPWNPHPVVDLPWLATILTAASLVVILGATLRGSFRSGTGLERFSALTVLSVVFTPLAADHHYMLLALPICVFLFTTDLAGASRLPLALTVIMLVLLDGWYPQPVMSMLDGWTKVLAFPRLFAAIVLWWMLKDGAWRTKGAGIEHS